MGALLELLKAAQGEATVHSRIGRWRLNVSAFVDTLVGFLLPPATGTNIGSRPLSGYGVVGLDAGTEVFVQGMNRWYRWDPTFTVFAENRWFVAPGGAAGNTTGVWISEDVIAQDTWVVDAVNGDDSNPGTTALPIQTLDELALRFSADKFLFGNTTITLKGGGFSKPLNIQCYGRPGTKLDIIGDTPTATATGSITAAFVPYGPATNVDAKLTDALQTWAPLIGQRIRMISGAVGTVGSIAWLLKDLGANVVRVSQFVNRTTGAMVNPLITDNYVVETLSVSVRGFEVNVSGGMTVTIKDIADSLGTNQREQVNATGTSANALLVNSCIVDGCLFEANGAETHAFNASNFVSIGCCVAGGSNLRFYLSRIEISCLASFGFVAAQEGAYITIIGTSVGQGGGGNNRGCWASYFGEMALVCDSTFAAASLGTYDATGIACLDVDIRGLVAAGFVNAFVFGSGNTTTNEVRVKSGCALTYLTKPVITGGGNDSLIGGTVKAWAGVPFVEPANNAMIVVSA